MQIPDIKGRVNPPRTSPGGRSPQVQWGVRARVLAPPKTPRRGRGSRGARRGLAAAHRRLVSGGGGGGWWWRRARWAVSVRRRGNQRPALRPEPLQVLRSPSLGEDRPGAQGPRTGARGGRGASGVGLSWRIGQLPAASSGWSGCTGTGVTSAATTCTTRPARRWSTLWLGSGWFTTPASTAKNSSWDTTTTLSGKEVAWGGEEELNVEVGKVGRRMTDRAFLGSDPGAPWNKGFSLEPHGITDWLLLLRLGQKQGVCGVVQVGSERSLFSLFLWKAFKSLRSWVSWCFFGVHSCYKWKDPG